MAGHSDSLAPSDNVQAYHQCSVKCAFRAPCCSRWFDCSECHFELSDHALEAASELVFLCKLCRKPFRKDLTQFGQEDEQCPHCGNALVVAAETGRGEANSTNEQTT